MSYKNLKPMTEMTCDRCGNELQVETGHFPTYWSRITRHAGYGTTEKVLDLCSPCTSDFVEYFNRLRKK